MQIKETPGLTSQALEERGRTGQAGRSGRGKGSSTSSSGGSTDTVQISGRSREMAKVSETLSGTPEVRSDRVAEIRRQIDNNEYTVDADKVAGKMILDFLQEVV